MSALLKYINNITTQKFDNEKLNELFNAETNFDGCLLLALECMPKNVEFLMKLVDKTECFYACLYIALTYCCDEGLLNLLFEKTDDFSGCLSEAILHKHNKELVNKIYAQTSDFSECLSSCYAGNMDSEFTEKIVQDSIQTKTIGNNNLNTLISFGCPEEYLDMVLDSEGDRNTYEAVVNEASEKSCSIDIYKKIVLQSSKEDINTALGYYFIGRGNKREEDEDVEEEDNDEYFDLLLEHATDFRFGLGEASILEDRKYIDMMIEKADNVGDQFVRNVLQDDVDMFPLIREKIKGIRKETFEMLKEAGLDEGFEGLVTKEEEPRHNTEDIKEILEKLAGASISDSFTQTLTKILNSRSLNTTEIIYKFAYYPKPAKPITNVSKFLKPILNLVEDSNVSKIVKHNTVKHIVDRYIV